MNTKSLVLRLSSLGDVILATSALEVSDFTRDRQVDWVVAKEFREVLIGHPRIRRLWSFDRSGGLSAWIHSCRNLWNENYDEVFDLHRSLRTCLMKILFLFWSLKARRKLPHWRTISKQRIRLPLYYLLKKFCPSFLKPTPWVIRYTQIVGGSGQERPNLRYLTLAETLPTKVLDTAQRPIPYICVMPSSRWDGKKWPVQSYLEVLKKITYLPVILGRKNDAESVALEKLLEKNGIPYFSAVGSASLAQTARILESAVSYLGSDTGLAHLAEAVGTPAKVILGPTTPEMGFGPWMNQSQSIGISLWCRPCGKDGQSCIRIFDKHRCLKSLSSDLVLQKAFSEEKNESIS